MLDGWECTRVLDSSRSQLKEKNTPKTPPAWPPNSDRKTLITKLPDLRLSFLLEMPALMGLDGTRMHREGHASLGKKFAYLPRPPFHFFPYTRLNILYLGFFHRLI